MSMRWFRESRAGIVMRDGRLHCAVVSKTASRIGIEQLFVLDADDRDVFVKLRDRLHAPIPVVSLLPTSLERYESASFPLIPERAPNRALHASCLAFHPRSASDGQRRLIWGDEPARNLAHRISESGIYFNGFIPHAAATSTLLNQLPVDHHGDYLIVDAHGNELTLSGYRKGVLCYTRTIRRAPSDFHLEIELARRCISAEYPEWSVSAVTVLPSLTMPEWISEPAGMKALPAPMTWHLPSDIRDTDMVDYWLAAAAALTSINSDSRVELTPFSWHVRHLFASPRLLWISVLLLMIMASLSIQYRIMNDRYRQSDAVARSSEAQPQFDEDIASWIKDLGVNTWLDSSATAVLNRLHAADPEHLITIDKLIGTPQTISMTARAKDMAGISDYIGRLERNFTGSKVVLAQSTTNTSTIEFEVRISSGSSGEGLKP